MWRQGGRGGGAGWQRLRLRRNLRLPARNEVRTSFRTLAVAVRVNFGMLTRIVEGVAPSLRPSGRNGNDTPREEYTPDAAVMKPNLRELG